MSVPAGAYPRARMTSLEKSESIAHPEVRFKSMDHYEKNIIDENIARARLLTGSGLNSDAAIEILTSSGMSIEDAVLAVKAAIVLDGYNV